MNPLDDHELLLWAMRAGLTRDEVRQAVRQGLDTGKLLWQTPHETDAQRPERMQAVYDYLQDRYLAGYDDYVKTVQARNAQGINEEIMAPWQWRQLPSHARARWLSSQHIDEFDTDDYGRLQAGPEWVHRKGQEHLFDIRAITEASFLGRTPEGDIISTWEPAKVMKRIQMLGAHEQVGFTDAPTVRGTIRAGSHAATTFNDTDSTWDFTGGEWQVYPGKRDIAVIRYVLRMESKCRPTSRSTARSIYRPGNRFKLQPTNSAPCCGSGRSRSLWR